MESLALSRSALRDPFANHGNPIRPSDHFVQMSLVKSQLIPLATTYMVGCCKPDIKEDMTKGVRTVEIVKSRYGDTNDSCYTNFLANARRCKDAENLSGPKHAIARLWFYHENGQQCSPSTNSSSSSSSNGSHHHKGSRTKAFLIKLPHRNK
ncbi:hypothetical protein BDB00DRAFT_872407 [Zychaea mexicana]|uniref:uncharacterized protein n=1 Tax=Zychaea mexicana TaxID=64656 RepID=UPI0022FF3519|nr:uncharacterized protein BDB00DRAFT_872407 [Zychaea mexicana]KAI9493300.1 hypothetical protein BDB00DRAFT_872407 [Zychaea mexicana]